MRAAVAALRLFLVTIALPLGAILMLALRRRQPIGGWLATFFAASGVVAFSFFTAPWGVFGFVVRYALLVLFVAAAVISLRRPPAENPLSESVFRSLIKLLLGFVFGGVALGVLRAHDVPPGAIDLTFPLRGGSFVIAHGGSTSAANMYNLDATQRFAVDVMQLNGAGMRARGLYPLDPRAYAIFGAQVVSPCDGVVRESVDIFHMGAPDPKHPLGNHVIVRCGDVDVTLSQLQRDTVKVKLGAQVVRGTELARVGNSGNASEPFLHVFATRNGVAVPARFDGKWLVRNNVVRR
jgi:hypothetical protein